MSNQKNIVARAVRRLFDLVFGSLIFITISPLLLVFCILNLLFLGKPIFYKQKRLGLFKKPFLMIKFRTMKDSRDARGNLLPDRLRLSRYGSWIRKFSIDELPNLINVIMGDMSIVGPRPFPEERIQVTDKIFDARYNVKPGITGWAQIHGRNNLTMREKFELDVWYVMHQSIFLDIKIILKTFFVLMKPEGVEYKEDVAPVEGSKNEKNDAHL